MSMAALLNARTHSLPDPALFEVVAKSLGGTPGDFSIGVHLGPPRANRKPVLAVTDRHGLLIAFAKYGVDALTDQLVSREAEALAEVGSLKKHGRLPSTQVPQLVASGVHAGHQYAVQTPVPTAPRTRDRGAIVTSQMEVARLAADALDGASAIATVRRRWMARTEVSDDPIVTAFAQLTSQWCDEADDGALSWGSWHGDWRVTNMSVTPAGCSLWDWERFGEGVPMGYDALHLFLTSRQGSVSDLAALPHDVRENAARLLRPFAVTDRRAVDLTVTGYLLELAGRYLDDDQAGAGARLGAVGQWLFPHLEQSMGNRHSTRRGADS
jgi:hypothetical protein